jgi:peptidoglycan L-alanyl-D-glutamate endopeptidase CwlK
MGSQSRAGLAFLPWFLLLLWWACIPGGVTEARADEVPAKARIFLRAYPQFFSGYKDGMLLCRDGGAITFDDGRPKTYPQLLADADPEDQLSQAYPTGPDSYAPPALNFDPGRFRCTALLKKMYGATPQEVEAHLRTIPWMPKSTRATVRITTANGVDRQLAAVSAELDQLPMADKKFVLKTAGTFNWRSIAGSNQLSAHSFGIAIDINPDYADYWRWGGAGPNGAISYRNRIPRRVIEIFERHGFLWGGKWYHFDTMHFEYRPELLP